MRLVIGFLFTFFSGLVCASDYIPPQAYQYARVIDSEITRLFSEVPDRHYVPALIEHESCIHLKHPRCWNPKSQLKTKRELGKGLGQITKAYNRDGSLRFDKLTEMRVRYKRELSEVSWTNVADRPDLQIRMILLMLRNDYGKLYDVKDSMERLAMTDNAYNGGLGGLQKERRQCGLTKGCDPNVWFYNVERVCLKSKAVLYGVRSTCDISRHHTADILNTRLPKYRRANYFVF